MPFCSCCLRLFTRFYRQDFVIDIFATYTRSRIDQLSIYQPQARSRTAFSRFSAEHRLTRTRRILKMF